MMTKNVFDGPEPIRAQTFGPRGCRFEPIGPILAAEPHEAKAGAIALFGMWASFQDAGHESACRRPGLRRPGN